MIKWMIFVCLLVSTFIYGNTEMSPFIPPEDQSLTMPACEVSKEEILSDEVQSLIDLMFFIARDNQIDTGNGIMVGLAAPQIGISKRVILVDAAVGADWKNCGNLEAFINPQITWFSDEISLGIEGCFSVDSHLEGKIPRFESIRVKAFDRQGNIIDQIFSGFTARIFQHEIDHLNGIRFPDRVGEHGVLHWVPDNQYHHYLEQWENWPLICPWQLWLDMKEGKPYNYCDL